MNDINDFQIVNDDLIDKYYFYDKDYELVTNSEGKPYKNTYKHKILYCYI